MSKLGAAFLTSLLLAATPIAAAEQAPHQIARDTAWGCRDKAELVDLLFLGMSASFDTKLATAIADGRCVYFAPGESVVIVGPAEQGLIRVQRPGASPVAYWTQSRNVN